MHAKLPLVLCLLAATTAVPAAAQPRDPAGAEVLYRAGRDAARRGDWTTACAKLAESQRLDPAAGTLLNLADCEEHRGQLAHAWQHFVQVQGLLPRGDARVTYAKGRADAVDKRVPRLSIRIDGVAPAGTVVLRDEQELGPPSLGVSLPVDPGVHVVVVHADGRADTRADISLVEGETRQLTVALGAPLGAAASPPASPADAPKSSPSLTSAPAASYTSIVAPETRSTYAYAFLGAGAVGIGIGAVAGAMALSKAGSVKDACGSGYATCTDASVSAAQDGKMLTTASTVAFAAGAAFAGVGIYLLLTPASSAPAKAALRVAPNGAAVTGTF